MSQIPATSPFTQCPTLAVRLLGRTLSVSRGPCLSRASWSAFSPASVPSILAGLGVNGFAYFSRKKSRSPAGAKPGNTNNQLDIMVVNTQEGFPVENVEND